MRTETRRHRVVLGANEHGQLGVMRGMSHAEPVQVPEIDDALAIAAGAQHASDVGT
jgi:hypothetical protein